MASHLPEVQSFVCAVIAESPGTPAYRDLLTRLMARPGRALAPSGSAKWPSFVLETCRALGGDPRLAVPAAAAVEFAVAAIDVIDDLIDDEWEGPADQRLRVMNAGLALGWLAQRCASQLVVFVGTDRARRVSEILVQGSLGSCVGQDLDLVLESMDNVGEDLALDMTRRKSGSLVAMGCQVGAAVATDDPTVLEMIGRFGSHVGIVAQLLNDIAGVEPSGPDRRNDLQRKKKTLPIAYTIRCAHEEGLSSVLSWYGGGAAAANGDEERLATAIYDLGALHYTWVVADAHSREALAELEALLEVTGRDQVRGLRDLLPSLRPRRQR